MYVCQWKHKNKYILRKYTKIKCTYAKINPKKNNGYIEYDYLCATTLAYFFLDLLSQKIKSKINLSDFLIYVLLATICDVTLFNIQY